MKNGLVAAVACYLVTLLTWAGLIPVLFGVEETATLKIGMIVTGSVFFVLGGICLRAWRDPRLRGRRQRGDNGDDKAQDSGEGT